MLETINDIRAVTWAVSLPILARLVHAVIDSATLHDVVDRDVNAAHSNRLFRWSPAAPYDLSGNRERNATRSTAIAEVTH